MGKVPLTTISTTPKDEEYLYIKSSSSGSEDLLIWGEDLRPLRL